MSNGSSIFFSFGTNMYIWQKQWCFNVWQYKIKCAQFYHNISGYLSTLHHWSGFTTTSITSYPGPRKNKAAKKRVLLKSHF